MKKTFKRIISAVIIMAGLSPLCAQGAVAVYADDIVSNTAVAVPESGPASSALATNVSRAKDKNPSVRVDETGVHIGGPNPVDIDAPDFARHESTGTLRHLTQIVAVVAPFATAVLFVAIIFYSKHRRNQMAHETLRAMIDKGAPITPELVANLRGEGCGSSSGDRFGRRQSGRLLPGLVLAGIGAAILITGSGHEREGWIVLFIGVAFLVVWAVERKNQNIEQPPR